MGPSVDNFVLVIDDDESIREFYQTIFDSYDISVIICDSAKTGLIAFDEHEISLVICDLVMPEMGGSQFLKILREDRQSKIPFIIVSGHLTSESIAQCKELGADLLIEKPIQVGFLFEKISSLL